MKNKTEPGETFTSDLSGKDFPVREKISARTIRHSVLDLIKKEHPEINHNSVISHNELIHYRGKYISEYLIHEIGELTHLEKKVLNSLKENSTLTDKLDGDDDKPFTLGQRVADKVATFGGSWTFIISFGFFIFIWISINILWLLNRGFDPYPFILLNLILSCIASLQAPVIMMSQNRQEEKDRDRAKKDYMINLKSELEIRTLHEKIDHFIMDQQQELLEIQKIQIEMMNDILERVNLIHQEGGKL
jgi:uncharacterized membrane protein